MLHNPRQHANKLRREGIGDEPIYTRVSSAAWECIELEKEYTRIVTEMCEEVNRGNLKELDSKLSDAPGGLRSNFRGYSKECVLYHELLPIVSRLEVLLDADAAQERPVLNSKERGAVRDVLREHLRSRRQAGRILLMLILAMISLAGWGYYSWSAEWGLGPHNKSSPARKGDFSELHRCGEDVE